MGRMLEIIQEEVEENKFNIPIHHNKSNLLSFMVVVLEL